MKKKNIAHEFYRNPYYHFLVLTTCLIAVNAAGRVKKVNHLVDHGFPSEEYIDPDNDIDERESGPEPPLLPLDVPFRPYNASNLVSSPYPDSLDPNIQYDSVWKPLNYQFNQISGVAIDPQGYIAIFHRGERVWNAETFDGGNRFNPNKGPILQSTILLVDKSGMVQLEWGRSMFFMPHGLTIDTQGNYWITDVAMHQVFKFDGEDIEQHKQKLLWQTSLRDEKENQDETFNVNSLFAKSIIKPSISLGVPFEPGNDKLRFCKPTAVAVDQNGDFFVSDGYCNSRVIKYNKHGERILEWGRLWSWQDHLNYASPPPNAFFIPHSIALAEEYDHIFVADRENGRIESFFASNGSFIRKYQSEVLGGQIYGIAYAQDRLYVVNGEAPLNNVQHHVRGYVIDIHSGEIISQFSPYKDMDMPHDITVSIDGREIYVVELRIKKVYRFLQDTSKITSLMKSKFNVNNSTGARALQLSDATSKSDKHNSTTVILVIIAALVMIFVCIAMAAMVAKYQKRGCLLSVRKRRPEWNDDRNDNFNFSNLLEPRRKFKIFEKRPNTRDFSKLNTEPETSDDENIELTLEKIV